MRIGRLVVVALASLSPAPAVAHQPDLLALGTPRAQAAAAPQAPATVIRGVTVISGTGSPPLHDATVVIRGTRIEAVGPSGAVPLPGRARIIDGRGKYLIPGLINTHTHLACTICKGASVEWQMGLEMAHGVTGLRDAAGIGDERTMVALRRRIDSARVVLPRLYVSGVVGRQNMPLARASGIAAFVRQLAAIGVDGIKLLSLKSQQADTAIAAARAAGLPVYGHTYILVDSVQYTLHAVENNVSGVMHLNAIGPASRLSPRAIDATGFARTSLDTYRRWIDATEPEEERLLRALLDHHVWLEPTLGVSDVTLHEERYRGRAELGLVWWTTPDSVFTGAPHYSAADLAIVRQGYERMTRFLRRFQGEGGLVLAGTDNTPWPGAGIHEEMRLLVDAGLTPMQALQAATRNAARALGWESRTGTIEAGKDADLVLLDADPLADIVNASSVRAVFRAGNLLDRAALDGLVTARRVVP